jgi:hypothetical protein
MSWQSLYFEPKSDKLSERQKKALKGYTFGKKTMYCGQAKAEYYCPTHKEKYISTIKHTHCKLCYIRHKKIDLHPVILYDKSKHEILG